jgi:hypothetical protein
MKTKNTYSDLFIANGVATTAANDARQELNKFVYSRLKTLHQAGRRVLEKEFGNERFQNLTAKDTGESLAWLLEWSLSIARLTEDSIVLTTERFSGKNGQREYTIKLDSIFGVSDWDFVFKVRQTIRHRAAALEEEQFINAENALRRAQREFNDAKAILEAAEKLNEQKRINAEGARERQSAHLHSIHQAAAKRRAGV